MKHLVEFETLAEIYLLSKVVGFQLYLLRMRLKVREKTKIMAKFTDLFSKKYIFKVLTDIR